MMKEGEPDMIDTNAHPTLQRGYVGVREKLEKPGGKASDPSLI